MDSQYFNDANLFGRVLRFLNLLEPGHMVLSLSKSAFWIAVGLVAYTLTVHPEQLIAVLGSVGGLGLTGGNYAYRRYTQIQQGVGPYPSTDFPDGPFGPEPFE